jgi:hypothetical protein
MHSNFKPVTRLGYIVISSVDTQEHGNISDIEGDGNIMVIDDDEDNNEYVQHTKFI